MIQAIGIDIFYFIKLESLGFQINSYDHLKAIFWEGPAYHETDNEILKLLIVLLPWEYSKDGYQKFCE